MQITILEVWNASLYGGYLMSYNEKILFGY
jgi:hypothetical protein